MRLSILHTPYCMKLKYLHVLILALISNTTNSQSTASQQVSMFSIAAPQLNSVKNIWVYLPTNYENSENVYPVIYMHDAQNLFDIKTAYAGEWEIDEYMDNLIDNQSIIIGIEHGNEKRIDELTPYTHKKHGGGNGASYLNFIKNTLKPHIDVAYRTKPEAEYTTIFGSSLGGLLSFYAIITYPETFGKAGIFSPSFWINPEIYDFVKSAEISDSSKFYFLAGTDESEAMVPDLNRMVALLKEKGVKTSQIKSRIIEDGRHNEKFWSTHFGEAYIWLNN